MQRSRVILFGDASRLGYRERLTAMLAEDGLSVVGPADGGADGQAQAQGAEAWLDEFAPDIACFSSNPFQPGAFQNGVADADPTPMPAYESGLLRLVMLLQRRCGRQVVFVTAPPVHQDRFHAAGNGHAGSDAARRFNHALTQYNQLATILLGQLNVCVANLAQEIARYHDDAFAPDGVSLSPCGVELAAHAVAKGIYGLLHA
jgi:hypothetical protein